MNLNNIYYKTKGKYLKTIIKYEINIILLKIIYDDNLKLLNKYLFKSKLL